jgi:hypothetical protein
VTPRGSAVNLRFGGTYRRHHQGEEISLQRASVVSSMIFVTLLMGALRSS